MANPWERDWSQPATPGAPWERDWNTSGRPAAVAPAEPAQDDGEAGIWDRLKDTGIDAFKGVVGLGESAVGGLDLITGNLIGNGLAKIGYDPQRTRDILASGYSAERQQENADVQAADGFLSTVLANVQNPAVALGTIVESSPMLLGSAGAIRAAATSMLAKAGIQAGTAEAASFFADPLVRSRLALIGSGAEGVMSAGSTQEQARQSGRDYTESVLPAIAGGVGTAAIGTLASRIPGLGDIETAVGTTGMGARGNLSLGKRIARGMFQEGVLEELPQSAQEQIFSNLAMGKPWDEGVAEAAATGLVAGSNMGALVRALEGRQTEPDTADQITPPTAPPAVEPQQVPVEQPVEDELAAVAKRYQQPVQDADVRDQILETLTQETPPVQPVQEAAPVTPAPVEPAPVLLRKNGKPFGSMEAAQSSSVAKQNPGATVVPVEGGFGIQPLVKTPTLPATPKTPPIEAEAPESLGASATQTPAAEPVKVPQPAPATSAISTSSEAKNIPDRGPLPDVQEVQEVPTQEITELPAQQYATAAEQYNVLVPQIKAARAANDTALEQKLVAQMRPLELKMSQAVGKSARTAADSAVQKDRTEQLALVGDEPVGTRRRPSEFPEERGLYWEKTAPNTWQKRGKFGNSDIQQRSDAEMAEAGGMIPTPPLPEVSEVPVEEVAPAPAPKQQYNPTEKPLAAEGLKSYRYRNQYGWTMIGATDDQDALKQAARSQDEVPTLDKLEAWDGKKYVPAQSATSVEAASIPPEKENVPRETSAAKPKKAQQPVDTSGIAEDSTPAIITSPRAAYLKQLAKAAGVKKGSPGYDAAIARIEEQYEADLDKAYASLSFEKYNELNSETPESINRQAYDQLRKQYGDDEVLASQGADLPSKQEILNTLKAHPFTKLNKKVKRAFVVGSFATGKQTDTSDIDVLLEVDGDAEAMQAAYRKRAADYFMKNNIRGVKDEVHPQWNGRRIDVYFTNNAERDATGPLVQLEDDALAAQDDEKSLYVAHNTTAEKIRHMDEIGGLAMPSLAISNLDNGVFDSFGNITLLAPPEITQSPKARTFNADIYSPRYPRSEIRVNAKKWDAWKKALPEKTDTGVELSKPEAYSLNDNGVRAILGSSSFLYSELKARGIDTDLPATARDEWTARTWLERQLRDKPEVELAIQDKAAEILKDVTDKKVIFKGFTNAGNRRYVDYTLENILKEMKGQLQGGETFNYGAGSLRARYAAEMKSIPQIRKRKSELVPEAEMEKIKEEANNRLFAALDELKPYYKFDSNRFGYYDDASSAIAEGRNGIREAFEADPEVDRITKEIVDYLVALPTEYFETKIQRAVGLNEFTVAVVPEGTAQDVLNILNKNGLEVRTYKSGDKAARAEAIRSAPNILFNQPQGWLVAETGVKGMPVDAVRKAIAPALEKLNQLEGFDVTVVQSKADLPQRMQDFMGKRAVRGIYSQGKVYLIADNINSERTAQVVLAHELVGHKGVLDAATPEEWADIKTSIANLLQNNARFAKEIMAEVDRRYPNAREEVRYKEFIALAAERKEKRGTIGDIMAKVKEILRRFLKSMGFTGPFSESDIEIILSNSERYLRESGEAAMANDEALASESLDAFYADQTRSWLSRNGYKQAILENGNVRLYTTDAKGEAGERHYPTLDAAKQAGGTAKAVEVDPSTLTPAGRVLVPRGTDGQDLFSQDESGEFEEENRRLREEDRTLWNRARQYAQRQFAPGGLLPDAVQEGKIVRDSQFEAAEFDVRHLTGELERTIREEYGVQAGKLSQADQEALSEALTGRMPEGVKPETKKVILAMRQYIDKLSKEYTDILRSQIEALTEGMDQGERALLQGYLAMMKGDAQAFEDAKEKAKQIWGDGKPMRAALDKIATIGERVGLMETILGNMGQYVHRSYQAFDDPDWFRKVPDATINAARKYLIERSIEQGADEKEATRRAEVVLHEILKNGTAYDSMEAFIKESKLGAKDLSVLKRRQDISPEIRALLGEYKDPRLNFAKSATKMSRLIWNQRFLDKVREVGMGTFLFEGDNRPPRATAQIAGSKSDAFEPLNGLWTFPEVNQAFIDALGKEKMENWYRTIVQLNGLVKMGKTVLAPTTALRNWQSAMFFTLANGHFNWKHMSKSIAGLREYFAHAGDKEKLAYLRKLKELGVVYDTPFAGEMMRLLDDSRIESWFTGSDLGMKGRKMINFAQRFYQYGDDFWKIIGFENEKALLMEHAGLTESEAEVEAAQRIRNTYPTYSLIGRAVQQLRRFPLAGSFVSFPAEIIRTTANMLRYIQKDLKDPKMRPLAYRRIAGMGLVAGFAYALQAITKSMFDLDDDDEDAIRLQAAPWQKNSNLAFAGRDEKGNIQFFDLSFLDPYNYWKRPITAVTRGQPWEEAAADVASELLKPFLGTDIAAGAIFEVMANKTETGGKIYKETDSPERQLADISNHLRKALQPGFVSNIERTMRAVKGEVSPSGQKYDLGDELMALGGWRASTLDPKVSLYYKAFDFGDAKSEATNTLTRVLTDPNKVSTDDIEDAYKLAMKMRARAYKDLQLLVQASRKSGLTDGQIRTALRGANLSRADINAMLNGTIPPWSPTRQAETAAVRRAEAALGPDKAKAIRERYGEARRIAIKSVE